MHKYRAAAKQAAWYNDENDEPDYNPFRKTRTRRKSQPVVTLPSAMQSDEAIHEGNEAVPPDAEATQANQSQVRIHTEDMEGVVELCVVEPRIVHAIDHAKTQKRRFTETLWSIFSEVWQNLADMGKSMTRHAVSVPNDAPVLEVPSRPIRFMVIEYAKQEDDIRGTRDQQTILETSLSALQAIRLVFEREQPVSTFTKVNLPEMVTGINPNSVE